MPNNRLWKKGLVIGIIVLFIGAGVYPAIAVNLKTSTNIIDIVENNDKSINDISNFDFDKLSPLMSFSMNPKLLNSIFKSYSKISNELYKLSSEECLEKVNKMVKEKLNMTLKTLKIIESKNLIDSSKIKIEVEDIYLKISEISGEYNELTSAFETQDGPPNICLILGETIDETYNAIDSVELIKKNTNSELVRILCGFIEIILSAFMTLIYMLFFLLNCLDVPPYP